MQLGKLTVVKYRGKEYFMEDLCKEKGIAQSTLRSRLTRGMSIEDAIDTPVKKCKRMWNINSVVTINGKSNTIKGWSQINCIPPGVIMNRLRRGWDLGRAIGKPTSIRKVKKSKQLSLPLNPPRQAPVKRVEPPQVPPAMTALLVVQVDPTMLKEVESTLPMLKGVVAITGKLLL